MEEQKESVIDRVNKLYGEFAEFYSNPHFKDFEKSDALIMFLLRKIASLQLYCEETAQKTNPIIDWAKYWDIKLKIHRPK